jgi:mono/diheme cytochrome c family protein
MAGKVSEERRLGAREAARRLRFALLLLSLPAAAQEIGNWDPPAIEVSPSHDDYATGRRPVQELIEAGRKLFATNFNLADGAGRPASTGDSKPTIRSPRKQAFTRVAGPDANSCAGCHNRPGSGGAGDFVTNVFVGAHLTDPPTESVEASVTNERGTLSIFGAGAVEMVAREMTSDLRDQLDAARLAARAAGDAERVSLSTKGVSFGWLTVRPDGSYATGELEGVDSDLIVKPFGVKGVAGSLREFTTFALNQHHGIQAEERFGWARTGVADFDEDGEENEFTDGQVSAMTIYQASLPPPRRVPYVDPERARLADLGERKFEAVGCTGCHRPYLPLRSAWFFEPSPYNRPGAIVPADVAGQIQLAISAAPQTGVYETPEGEVRVAAFTDLKRHVICDKDDPYFCNERLRQDFVPTDQFLTTKLWDAGSSAPYGHRGDLTTLSEAIVHHSGEAKGSKLAFLALPDRDKRAVILFLKTLQIEDDPKRK